MIRKCLFFALMLAILAAGLVAAGAAVLYPSLPSLDRLADYRPRLPLRVLSADGRLLGEFGEEHRAFMPVDKVPARMREAILAAEDERFYTHAGIDWRGIVRAAAGNILSGQVRSGASTITMQVARNFYLSGEKTFSRKFSEILLAFKIEQGLTKDRILELYLNQIYLGQRAYGFAAAAETYYGRPLSRLSTGEMAMLAGLPKAPSAYNPVVNPDRARLRQRYVLRRMLALGFISREEHDKAVAEPVVLARGRTALLADGAYVAEMVRQAMVERYKEKAYEQGFVVYTTIDSRQQSLASAALRDGLVALDARSGYQGPEAHVDLPATAEALDSALDAALEARAGSVLPAGIVTGVRSGVAAIRIGDGRTIQAPVRGTLVAGDVVRVQSAPAGRWQIVRMPDVEGALVALDPANGAIRALAGGFDFGRNPFNHVTSAWRQPGSAFKPFVYSAALDKGMTAATRIEDAPLTVTGEDGTPWSPRNDDRTFGGPVTLREALVRSRNLVSVRVLLATGANAVQRHVGRFGFDPARHPAYPSMALGAGLATPLQVAEGYAAFANGGYRTRGWLIDRIEDAEGRVLARTAPRVAGVNAERVIDPRNAFIIDSMLRDVVRRGTGRGALATGRNDLAGKTGTTSDWKDAWFAGFHPSLATVVWVGHDQPRSLGSAGYGGAAALPIWTVFMGKALDGVPARERVVPEGIVTVRQDDGGVEYFMTEPVRPDPAAGDALDALTGWLSQ